MSKYLKYSLIGIFIWLLVDGFHTTEVNAQSGSRWGANYFPNVPLTKHDGTRVRFYDDLLKGKAVVISFIYTSCEDSCPLETARLVQVQRLLGDRVGRDIFMYSISIDPERDTPAALSKHREKYGVGPGWDFLTGKREDVDLIRMKLGLYIDDLEQDNDHSLNLIMGNEPMGRWRKHNSIESPQFLAGLIGGWLHNWKTHKATHSYKNAPKEIKSSKGQYLFRTRCAACHTIGKGDAIGPDLLGVTRKRDQAWLARWIATPDQMLAEGDPVALQLLAQYNNIPMPNLRLSEIDVNALIVYLETQSNAFVP